MFVTTLSSTCIIVVAILLCFTITTTTILAQQNSDGTNTGGDGTNTGGDTSPTTINADVQILQRILKSVMPPHPLPKSCPYTSQKLKRYMHNAQYQIVDKLAVTNFTIYYGRYFKSSVASGSSQGGFDGRCLLEYWYGLKKQHAQPSPYECMSGGGGDGSHGTMPTYPSGQWTKPSDYTGTYPPAPTGWTRPPSGDKTEDPMSSVISSLMSSVIESVIASMQGGGNGGKERDAAVDEREAAAAEREAVAAGSSFGSNTNGGFPGGGSSMGGSHDGMFTTKATAPPPACVPFQTEAACVMVQMQLQEVLAYRQFKEQYPQCYKAHETRTPPPDGTTQATRFSKTPPPDGTTQHVTRESRTPPPDGTTQHVTRESKTPPPDGTTQHVTRESKTPPPDGTTFTRPTRESSTPPPDQTTQHVTRDSKTPPPDRTTQHVTRDSKTPPPDRTTVAPPETSTRPTRAPTTAVPPGHNPTTTAAPTSVTATIDPSTFSEKKVVDALAAKLSVAASTISITMINATTIDIQFNDPNAAQTVERVEQLVHDNATALAAVGLSNVQAAPGEAPAEESSLKDKLPLLAGVGAGVIILLAGVAYGVNKYSKGGDGGDGNDGGSRNMAFNMDFDESAYYGDYASELQSFNKV